MGDLYVTGAGHLKIRSNVENLLDREMVGITLYQSICISFRFSFFKLILLMTVESVEAKFATSSFG